MKLNIMDTAGQERFDAISNIFYRNAIGALLVFDVTDEYSFITLDEKLKKLKQNAGDDIVIMLVGNKCDLKKKRVIEY